MDPPIAARLFTIDLFPGLFCFYPSSVVEDEAWWSSGIPVDGPAAARWFPPLEGISFAVSNPEQPTRCFATTLKLEAGVLPSTRRRQPRLSPE
jgi:hypothetical protein